MSTWMVVEDEPDIYEVLLAMFELWGIEGVAFVDGPEAVHWIDDVDQGRVRADLPELAILDIRLPELSGPAIARRLRRSPVLGNIGIVLITAYRLSPDEENAVLAESQADLLLYKPLPSLTELRETIQEVIAKHRASRPQPPAPPAQVAPAAPAQPAGSSAPGASAPAAPPAPQSIAPQASPAAPAKTHADHHANHHADHGKTGGSEIDHDEDHDTDKHEDVHEDERAEDRTTEADERRAAVDGSAPGRASLPGATQDDE